MIWTEIFIPDRSMKTIWHCAFPGKMIVSQVILDDELNLVSDIILSYTESLEKNSSMKLVKFDSRTYLMNIIESYRLNCFLLKSNLER